MRRGFLSLRLLQVERRLNKSLSYKPMLFFMEKEVHDSEERAKGPGVKLKVMENYSQNLRPDPGTPNVCLAGFQNH